VLITDGLPTQGKTQGLRRYVNSAERMRLFDEAVSQLPEHVRSTACCYPWRVTAGRAPLLAPGARHRRYAPDAAKTGRNAPAPRSGGVQPVVSRLHLLRLRCHHPAAGASEIGQPAALEQSRKHLGGEVRLLEEQLNTLRGQTEELNRELSGSRETLERERGRLTNLAGDLSSIRGRYAGSREDAAVTNIIERQLVAAQQTLTEDMQRLLALRAQSPRSAAIGGIPIDSDYVIFIIDTSRA